MLRTPGRPLLAFIQHRSKMLICLPLCPCDGVVHGACMPAVETLAWNEAAGAAPDQAAVRVCAGVHSIEPLVARLEAADVPYTRSMSGRPALFFRDPDMNVLEIGEMGAWRE